jgi:hypothetical protein
MRGVAAIVLDGTRPRNCAEAHQKEGRHVLRDTHTYRHRRVIVVPHPAWGEDKNMTFYMDKRDEQKSDDEYLAKYPCTNKVNTFNSPEVSEIPTTTPSLPSCACRNVISLSVCPCV